MLPVSSQCTYCLAGAVGQPSQPEEAPQGFGMGTPSLAKALGPQEGQGSQEASPTFLSLADGGRPFGGSSQV